MNGTDKLIPVEVVAEMLGVHIATVWRQSKVGVLPKPIRIAGVTRWRLSGIEAAIAEAEARAA